MTDETKVGEAAGKGKQALAKQDGGGKQPPETKVAEAAGSGPEKPRWFVWFLVPGLVKQPKLIVEAESADEAWVKFCGHNGVDVGLKGGRVVRPALDAEVSKLGVAA